MAERKRTHKEKNPNREYSLYLVNIIVLCVITLAAVAAVLYMLFMVRGLRRNVGSLNAQLSKLQGSGKVYYTKDQVDNEVSRASAAAAEKERRNVLMQIQSSLESGRSTTSLLRSLFVDDLVVVNDGKYYFFPIYSSLGKSGIQSGDFDYDETGALQYAGSNESISIHKGVDVSSGNGDIDWSAVAEDGLSFAMVRLGAADEDGKATKDKKFEANMKGLLDNGMGAGVYYELNAATEEEAIAQADFVIAALQDYEDQVTYPVAVIIKRVEDDSRLAALSRLEWSRNLNAFCEKIKEAGYTPMIYGNLATFLMQTDLSRLDAYEKWIADFSNNVYFPYKYSLWQYSTSGQVQGIGGNVHLDIQITGD